MGGGGTVVPITRTGVRSRGVQAACLLGFRAVADPRFKGRAVADPAGLALRAVLPSVELPCVGRSGRSFLPSGVAFRSMLETLFRVVPSCLASVPAGLALRPTTVPAVRPAWRCGGRSETAFLRFFHYGAREGRGSSGVPALPALPAVLPAVLPSCGRSGVASCLPCLPSAQGRSVRPWVRRALRGSVVPAVLFGVPSPRSGSFGGSFRSFIGTARGHFSPYIGRKTQLDPAQPLDRSGFEPVFAPVLFVGRSFLGRSVPDPVVFI